MVDSKRSSTNMGKVGTSEISKPENIKMKLSEIIESKLEESCFDVVSLLSCSWLLGVWWFYSPKYVVRDRREFCCS